MALIVYTTSWCGFCARLKAGLDAAEIPFEEIDIDADIDAADAVMQANRGNRTVPTVRFEDGSTLTNPSVAEVRAKLAA